MTKNQLLEKLQAGFLKTPRIIRSFEKIDRADFVPAEFQAEAYGDYPLSIGQGQTISQPSTVVFMLELLAPRPGEKILDLGAGSGWTTALLAEIVGSDGKVVGIEAVSFLVKFGRKNLVKYNFSQAEIISAGSQLGSPDQAPFDRILVSAAAEKLPEQLVNQLKIGGRLVLPINQSLWRINKDSGGGLIKEEFPGFVFVPLV